VVPHENPGSWSRKGVVYSYISVLGRFNVGVMIPSGELFEYTSIEFKSLRTFFSSVVLTNGRAKVNEVPR
jgi:hypothetical protein